MTSQNNIAGSRGQAGMVADFLISARHVHVVPRFMRGIQEFLARSLDPAHKARDDVGQSSRGTTDICNNAGQAASNDDLWVFWYDNPMTAFGSAIIAVLAALFCIWLLRPIAIQLGFVDRPGGRKQHLQNVPLIGGVAIFFGFCFALLSLSVSLQDYRALIAGGSLLLVMGVVDDFRELNSRLRLLGQIAAALCLVGWGNLSVNSLGNLWFFGNIHLGWLAVPLTVLMVVGFLNAMNMIDGQDGLAGSVALGQAVQLAFLAWYAQRHVDFYLLIIFSLLLITFLTFNMPMPWRKHAAIFLGDAGSTFVAFVIAWFAISIGQSETPLIKPAVIVWILAFPVFDLLQVCFRRFRQRRPLLLPSRDHFHHILQAGLNIPVSTVVLTVFSFTLGLIGILLNYFQVTEGWQFLGWLFALVGYIWVVKLVRKVSG